MKILRRSGAPTTGVTDISGPTLRTTSLTRRVLLSSLAVLFVVLTGAGILADVLLGSKLQSDAVSRLQSRAELAQEALDAGATAGEILAAAKGDGITVSLIQSNGKIIGNEAIRPSPPRPGSGPGAPPSGGQVAPPTAAGAPPADANQPAGSSVSSSSGSAESGAPDSEQLTRQLSDGTLLTVAVDTDGIREVRSQLRVVLYPLLAAALLLAGLMLLFASRTALRPLDRMTALAQSITRGQRGRRLNSSRTDTEMGRTATAFDEMLDALEGAEATARDSEARIRRFVADAAHELRTPIAGISAAAQAVISVGSAAEPERREQLELLVVREARRAGRLIEDLLSLATIESGLTLRLQGVELRSLLRAEATRIQALRTDLQIDVTGPECRAWVDPERIAQVVANLLDNARRYTRRPGHVAVQVNCSPDEVAISVVDNGPGIPLAERERIFDRLVRLDAARSQEAATGTTAGSGLGLAIACGIARAHHGDLSCVEPPAPWTGAHFVLRLPRLSSPDSAAGTDQSLQAAEIS